MTLAPTPYLEAERHPPAAELGEWERYHAAQQPAAEQAPRPGWKRRSKVRSHTSRARPVGSPGFI